MFSLQRVYAFTVTPQRGAAEDGVVVPTGGSVKLTPGLREVVENAFSKVAKSILTTVDFSFDANRANPVREEILAIAFGATQTPRAAAARLASRLAQTMDNRSHSALLLLAVEADGASRRVSLLVLPREDVVQLHGSDEEVLLDLLRNAFSTGSGLRKVARVSGHNSRTQFLSVEVLDLQLTSNHKTTADFWVRNFLEALPRVDAATGSKHLAAALQRAFDAADEDDRDAVFAAMFKASSGAVTRTSLARFAEELPDGLQDAFFRGVATDEMRRTVFTVDRTVMKECISRRIFTTKDGVVISAPTDTVGKSVEVKKRGNLRVVSYSGAVEKERVARGRRGRSDGADQ
jgi:hypothetical protein